MFARLPLQMQNIFLWLCVCQHQFLQNYHGALQDQRKKVTMLKITIFENGTM